MLELILWLVGLAFGLGVFVAVVQVGAIALQIGGAMNEAVRAAAKKAREADT